MKNNPYDWKSFAAGLPSSTNLKSSVDSGIMKITVGGVAYPVYSINEESAKEFNATSLDSHDDKTIKASLNERLKQMSLELVQLSEQRIKEIIADLFGVIAVEYALKKNKEAKDTTLAKYKDLGDWARHYSTVRLSIGTFFVTGSRA